MTRGTYTSRIGWRGQILAVEDTVDAVVTRVCIFTSVRRDFHTIAINERELIGEESVAAFSSTTAAAGVGNDSLLALRPTLSA